MYDRVNTLNYIHKTIADNVTTRSLCVQNARHSA